MDAVRDAFEVMSIGRALSSYGNRFVATLKDMPMASATEIPSLGETAHKEFHSRGEIRLGRFQKEVEMIADQHPRMDEPAMADAGPLQPGMNDSLSSLPLKIALPPSPRAMT